MATGDVIMLISGELSELITFMRLRPPDKNEVVASDNVIGSDIFIIFCSGELSYETMLSRRRFGPTVFDIFFFLEKKVF